MMMMDPRHHRHRHGHTHRHRPQKQRQRPRHRYRGGGAGGDHDADAASRHRMEEAIIVEGLLRDAVAVVVVGLGDRLVDADSSSSSASSPPRRGRLFPSVRQCNSGE
jgi:hypothetical protein